MVFSTRTWLRFGFGLLCLLLASTSAWGNSSSSTQVDLPHSVFLANGLSQQTEKIADFLESAVFVEVSLFGQSIPVVVLLLAGTGVLLTLVFGLINLRGIPLALRTITGRYTRKDAPGEITHFQALTSALSATVGLGNIAGVAIAIGIGGPGACFWMIVMGLLGMTTKFVECTLGVRYRVIDSVGKVHGGPMYYLSRGFQEKGNAWGKVGFILAVFFAIFTIGGALGAGNMYQANQAYSQFSEAFGLFQGGEKSNGALWFGLILALTVAAVILGGIKSIGKVTAMLIPFMTLLYVGAAMVILILNFNQIGSAATQIFQDAFAPTAVLGGAIGALIQGVRRAVFSNEAGLGSAPIAHAAVKTDKPASEGLVALLEPFVDTVVVCTMTALVIIITGQWKVDAYTKEESTTPIYLVESAALQQQNKEGDVVALALADLDETAIVSQAKAGTEFRVLEKKESVVGEQTTSWAKIYPEQELLAYLQQETPNLAVAEDGENGVAKQFILEEQGLEPKPVQLWIPLSHPSIATQMDITKTSAAFSSAFASFDVILAVAVVLFAFSTMLSWSYYGEQAVLFLCGGKYNKAIVITYKLIFCAIIVLGAQMSLKNVLRISDSLLFLMVVPNLIGLYFLLPKVKESLADYQRHVKSIDQQK